MAAFEEEEAIRRAALAKYGTSIPGPKSRLMVDLAGRLYSRRADGGWYPTGEVSYEAARKLHGQGAVYITKSATGRPLYDDPRVVPPLVDVPRLSPPEVPRRRGTGVLGCLGAVAAVATGVVLLVVLTGRHTPTPQASPSPAGPGPWKLVRTITSQGMRVYDMAWSPDSTMIAASGENPDGGSPVESRVWRVSDGALVTSHHDPGVSTRALSWSPDGGYIASADSDGVQIWHAQTGRTAVSIPADQVGDVSWSPDSRYIVMNGPGYTEVRRATTGAKVTPIGDSNAAGTGANWSPKDDLIVSGGIVWNGLDGKQVQAWKRSAADAGNLLTENAGDINDSIWSPDGRHILSYGGANAVVWDETTGTTDWQLELCSGHFQAAWSPDGKYVAVACSGAPQIADWASGQRFGYIDDNYFYAGHTEVEGMAWSPNGKFLATASGGTVQIWQNPGY